MNTETLQLKDKGIPRIHICSLICSTVKIFYVNIRIPKD